MKYFPTASKLSSYFLASHGSACVFPSCQTDQQLVQPLVCDSSARFRNFPPLFAKEYKNFLLIYCSVSQWLFIQRSSFKCKEKFHLQSCFARRHSYNTMYVLSYLIRVLPYGQAWVLLIFVIVYVYGPLLTSIYTFYLEHNILPSHSSQISTQLSSRC